MPQSYIVAGLDIGTTKICVTVAEVGIGDEPNIIGVGVSACTGLKKGIVVDLDSTTAAIQDAVKKAEIMSGEEIRSAIVGVTGEHISCLNSRSVIAITRTGTEISTGDVDRLIDSAKVIVLPPDREIVHAIPRWFAVDGQQGVQSPVGMYGNRLEVETHIVTGLSSFIQNVVKCVHQAGLSVEATVLEPIATGEGVLLPAERELGVVLVDIGGGTSDIAIYIDGQIYYSAAIPVGGNHVTRDIAIGLRTSLEEAERVKLTSSYTLAGNSDEDEIFEVLSLGSSRPRRLPVKVLDEIIEPRMSELLGLVVGHIKKAGVEERVPGGIVFTGGGSQIKGLEELAEEFTGMPVRAGKIKGLTGLVDSVSNPSFATGVGLVLYWTRYGDRHNIENDGGNIVLDLYKRIKDWLSARFRGD